MVESAVPDIPEVNTKRTAWCGCIAVLFVISAAVAALWLSYGYYFSPAPRLDFPAVLPDTVRLYADAEYSELTPEGSSRVSRLLSKYWDIARSPELLHFSRLNLRCALAALGPGDGDTTRWIFLLEADDASSAGEIQRMLTARLLEYEYREAATTLHDVWQLQEFTGQHNLTVGHYENILLLANNQGLMAEVCGRIAGNQNSPSLAGTGSFQEATQILPHQPSRNPFIYCDLAGLAGDLTDTDGGFSGDNITAIREGILGNIRYFTAAGQREGGSCRFDCRVGFVPGSTWSTQLDGQQLMFHDYQPDGLRYRFDVALPQGWESIIAPQIDTLKENLGGAAIAKLMLTAGNINSGLNMLSAARGKYPVRQEPVPVSSLDIPPDFFPSAPLTPWGEPILYQGDGEEYRIEALLNGEAVLSYDTAKGGLEIVPGAETLIAKAMQEIDLLTPLGAIREAALYRIAGPGQAPAYNLFLRFDTPEAAMTVQREIIGRLLPGSPHVVITGTEMAIGTAATIEAAGNYLASARGEPLPAFWNGQFSLKPRRTAGGALAEDNSTSLPAVLVETSLGIDGNMAAGSAQLDPHPLELLGAFLESLSEKQDL